MRRGVRRLRAAFAENMLLGFVGLAAPLVVVLGIAIASNAAQDILGQDWDWLDDHLGQIQLALAAVMVLVGIVLFRSGRTRPAGAGMLLGLGVVLLIVAAVLLFWLALVVIWAGGCTAQGGC